MRHTRLSRLQTIAAATLAVVFAMPAAAQQPRAVDVTPPFQAEMVADLAEPWAMTFLPDGQMLVTEKRGALHVVTPSGQVSAAIAGVPEATYNVHGGLGDVVLHPDFAENRLVYLTWADAGD